jgi:hypothetical protein
MAALAEPLHVKPVLFGIAIPMVCLYHPNGTTGRAGIRSYQSPRLDGVADCCTCLGLLRILATMPLGFVSSPLLSSL